MTFKNWINSNIIKDQDIDVIVELLKKEKLIRTGGLFGSSFSLSSSILFNEIEKSIIIVCKDENEAKEIHNDLETFGAKKAYYFPSIETTPYHSAVIDDDIRSERLEVLNALMSNEECIVTLSLDTLLFHVTPREILEPYFISITKEQKMNISDLSKSLIESGFTRVSKVNEFGEFAVRGDIVDIYYSIHKNPIRIDFFDVNIESIKSFDSLTQKSLEELDAVMIPPNKEYVYGEGEIRRFKKKLGELEGNAEEKELILESITDFKSFDGEQYYLSLFYEKVSFLEYFNEAVLVINDLKTIKKREQALFDDFENNYHSTAFKRKPRAKPEDILFSLDEMYDKAINVIESNYFEDLLNPYDYNFNFTGIPVYLGNLVLFTNDAKKYLNEGYKLVIFAGTDIQTERLQGIFKELNPSTDKFDFEEKGLSILPLNVSAGFVSEESKVFFLNDYEIFGKRKKISRHFYTKRTEVIDSFVDLAPGDYIVHINHGIGKFLGIERIKSMGEEKEYLSILYSDDDKIFIPVEQLNFIQKYISEGFAKPKLDRIGSKGWSKTKQRVREKIEELAKELIQLYSYRLKQKGFAFLPDTPWQKEFEAKFPYEETDDQLLTIEEVKRDMESKRPMDRLICGDVGFGKTEIAIRAAFKAVMSGKQVVMLVPTTILAEQHYETFSERLKDYPVNVQMLSRFKSAAEQKVIIRQVIDGDVDVIIGTHRLLSNDIGFKNPGLYIIDEEQRFGVKHKEKIKQARMNIDSLSMTATPIPRTLHMSLANIRDVSIINTPPLNRQSVETYVTEFNEEILIEAVKREIARGGQIFFLYNRIKTIYDMKAYLKQLVPAARIVVAHGQLHEDDLEDIIHDFIHHEYDIMLTTTIIESGIDMPRVNTIFIDRADKFGLSQLYQLRGRVGRSEKKAYAYLFYDKDVALTEEAMKRLRVISEYTELGSGFKVAMKDMEIRGAGNLLGPEQHGDILAVGFQLYCKLLSEAIAELAPEDAKGLVNENEDVYLELQYSGFIPDAYISDHRQKIEFYKKIASVTASEEVEDIKSSLIDRFGPIPDEMRSLFYLAEIRLLCRSLHISELAERNNKVEIKFSKFNEVDVTKLMKLIQESNGNVYVKSNNQSSIFVKLNEISELKDKGEYLKGILANII